jgi:hypothetical protein
MFIRIKNTQSDNSPKTFLSDAIAAGATSAPVKNINDFTNNYYAQFGQVGEERSEIALVNGTPSNGTVTIGALRYPQPTDTPVFAIKYNKVVVKRSTTGTAGSASLFGTTSITPDQIYTQFEDTTSQPGYAYKTAFYNSALDVYSLDSNWITSSGYSIYSRGGLRTSVRSRIKNIPGIEDDDINSFFDDYMEMMRNAAFQVNEDYGLGTLNIAVGAGTQEYAITDDLHRSPARVWMINGAGTVPYHFIPMSQIDPNMDYSWDPRFYMSGDDTVGFLPIPTLAGTAQIIQNEVDSELTSDDQELPRPMKQYRTGFINYACSLCYRQDGKDQLAEVREKAALNMIELFKKEISPRQTMENEQVNMVQDSNFLNDFSSWGN